jgi:hypothetical protein
MDGGERDVTRKSKKFLGRPTVEQAVDMGESITVELLISAHGPAAHPRRMKMVLVLTSAEPTETPFEVIF